MPPPLGRLEHTEPPVRMHPMISHDGFNAPSKQGGVQSLTEHLNSHGLLEAYIKSPKELKERHFGIHVVTMQECRGVTTSKNKKSYLPFDMEYGKWLGYEVERNAPKSPYWHGTLETHIPGIARNNWILEGIELVNLNEENAAAAGVQRGDRGSGNELKVFMGTLPVAQQYLACDQDESGQMTYMLYMLNVIPMDKVRKFHDNNCVHTSTTARVIAVYVRIFRPECGNQGGHFQQNHLQVIHGPQKPLSFPDAWSLRKRGQAYTQPRAELHEYCKGLVEDLYHPFLRDRRPPVLEQGDEVERFVYGITTRPISQRAQADRIPKVAIIIEKQQ